MEAVHVKLSDEAVHLVVTEVAWKYKLLKFVGVFDDKFGARAAPIHDLGELFIVQNLIGLADEPGNLFSLLRSLLRVGHFNIFKLNILLNLQHSV